MPSGGFLGETIAQGHERVERDQTLVIENGTDAPGDFVMHLLALRSGLRRTGEQFEDAILRAAYFPGRKAENLAEGLRPAS